MSYICVYVVSGAGRYVESTYLPAPETTHTKIYDILPQHS